MHTTLLVATLILQGAVMAPANPCEPGVKVAESCIGVTQQGCCTNENAVRWCTAGVLCELSCDSAPACGWKESAGMFSCASLPKTDDACQNPYSCFVDGCAATWEQKGCCDCPCEDCVCAQDPYCCNVAWDPVCVDRCRECGGCGSKDGCTPSTTPGCHGCACELCVCQLDPFCCTDKWDSLCAQACVGQCAGGCQPCQPDCTGKECGSDGCGGKCGICPPNAECDDGECIIPCVPKCSGKECGQDGCGGSCGTCLDDHVCNLYGQCIFVCEPDCTGKECGSDGCTGSCGKCEDAGCLDGKCVPDICVPECDGKQCGDDGCGWFCGFCPPLQQCLNGKCSTYCVPQCLGKLCGDDGCGGSCGTCGLGLACTDGQCIPPCFPTCQGKECGSDHCCGDCGACAPGMVCQDPPGTCVFPDACVPNCMGKECGDDGCGGTCGQCPMNWFCQKGMCVPQCSPQCLVPPGFLTYKQCGWDECPGENSCMGTGVCGVCPEGFYCGSGYVCIEDTCSCVGMECGEPKMGCPSCGDCPEGLSCDMETLLDPETNVCEACQPSCFLDDGVTPKACGNDGCGGSCGVCPQMFKCDEDANDGDLFYFQCEPCVPQCINDWGAIKDCGDDGCGGNCGQCQFGMACLDAPEFPEYVGTEQEGTCESCVQQCMTPPNFIFPMECGPNNCPAGCLQEGTVPCKSPNDCLLDEQCNAETGMCVKCGACGTCPPGWICDTSTDDDADIYVCQPCIPDCAGKECGSNGCPPGTCGTCPIGFECSKDNKCLPQCDSIQNCFGRQCGPNDCPSGCTDEPLGDCTAIGECPEGQQCDPTQWKCVECNDVCGTCPGGYYCVEDYSCQPIPSCGDLGLECGPDGLGGDCGQCAEGKECVEGLCIVPGLDEGPGEDIFQPPDDIVTSDDTAGSEVVVQCGNCEKLVDGTCVADDTAPGCGTVEPDAGNQPGLCGPCEKPYFNTCVAAPEKPGCGEKKDEGGCSCSMEPRPAPFTAYSFMFFLFFGLYLAGRRIRLDR
jgi:hypothetical protein